MIKYDLSDIPQGAKIKEATLSFYNYAIDPKLHNQTRNAAKSIYKITSSWQARTVNWNSNVKFTSSPIADNPSTSIRVWLDYDVTATIKDVIENGAANNGFLMKFKNPSRYLGAKIYASESSQRTYRPKLKIVYTPFTNIRLQMRNEVKQFTVSKHIGGSYTITGKLDGVCDITVTNSIGKILHKANSVDLTNDYVLPEINNSSILFVTINYNKLSFTKKFYQIK